MAQERVAIDLSKKASSIDDDKRKEFRAKAAKVLSRIVVADRLAVELPGDVHGEWIRDEPTAIAEAQALGFELDSTYAVKNKLHTDAAGKAKIGDTIFMTIPRWQKEEIDKIKQEHYNKLHGVRGSKPAEELNYESNISSATPVINESKTSNVSLSTIASGD
jgi:hypothetical protein